MPDKETQSLEALEGRATKEISRADRTHDLERSRQQQEHELRVMGWLGKFWGGGKAQTSNVTGLALILFSVTLVLLIILIAIFDKALLSELIGGVISIITLSLGYLFGQGSTKGR